MKRFAKLKHFLGKEVIIIFLLSVGLGLLWFVAETAFIFIVQSLFNNLGLIPDKTVYFKEYLPSTIGGVTLCLFLFTAARAILSGLKNYFAGISVQSFTHHQKKMLLGFIVSDEDLKMSSHEMITLLNQNVPQASNVVRQVSTFITTLTSSVLLFAFGLTIAPLELAIGFTILVCFILPFKYINKEIEAIGSSITSTTKSLNRYVTLSLKNYFLLRIYQHLHEEIGKGTKVLNEQYKHMKRYYLITSFKSSVPLFIGGLVISLLLYLVVSMSPKEPLKLLAFFYTFIRLSQSLSETTLLAASIRMSWKFAKELFDTYESYKIKLAAKFISSSNISSESLKEFSNCIAKDGICISAKKITFGFGGTNIFEDYSLNVKSGEVVVIKGPSGVGKSTLLGLITGIYKATKGSIEINNYNINDIKPALVESIGYVGPDSYIIPGTVLENLYYCSLQEVDYAHIQHVLLLTQMDVVVNSLPHGLNSMLSENTELSTGQKQRLSIARALLRKPKLIVFDEATSNLDKDTEKGIITSIFSKLDGLTTIIITHRDSFDMVATKIVNLNKVISSEEELSQSLVNQVKADINVLKEEPIL